MNINQRVIKLQQKCINKLNREDAEFFFNVGTIKDLAVFCSMVKLKSLSFKDDFELEMMIVRYLQILMILSTVSDDPRDKHLVVKYRFVPFECEEIVKMRRPYKYPENIDKIFQLIEIRYPLPAYWEAGGLETESLLESIPKESAESMNLILEYYSTPILGMMSVLEVKPRNFHFFLELKELLHDELNNNSKSGIPYKENGNTIINTMKWVMKFDLKKIA